MGEDERAGERGCESEVDTLVPVFGAHLRELGCPDLIEGRQRGRGVLGLLQALRDAGICSSLSHPSLFF